MKYNSNFKLNNQTFKTVEELQTFAQNLISKGEHHEISIGKFIQDWLSNEESITVKTSGSTGIPKEIKLQKEQMRNSAISTGAFFNLPENTSALLCMSADYIGGKMMVVRAMVLGWDLTVVEPTKNPLQNLQQEFDFAAMVPYQVFNSIDDLHKIKKLIIGGGSISADLEVKLQNITTECYSTYGMTETISHIAIRNLNGPKKTVFYEALPNVQFSKNENDCLVIDAPLISNETLVTNDVVELISNKKFKFLGRIDNVINSGGIKIYPEIIEKKLASEIKQPFFIASEKDKALGEKVVLIIESDYKSKKDEFSVIFENLSKYERPKKIISIEKFLYTETGKIKRAETLAQIQ